MMENRFSNREMLILSYLDKYKTGTAKDLAEFLGVSERTIKNDINSIKGNLSNNEIEIESIPGLGYHYVGKSNFNNEQFKNLLRDKDLILHNYDRISYIIQEFLASEDYIKYENLADKLYISRSTLQKDMIKVKELVDSFNLVFIQKPNYGVRLTGEENDFRTAILYFIYNSFWGILGENRRPKEFQLDDKTFRRIVKIIKKKIEGIMILNDNMIENLAYMIRISRVRIKKDYKLIQVESNDSNLRCVAQGIIEELDMGHTDKIKNTVCYIANYIAGYEIRNKLNDEENALLDQLLERIMDEIYKNFDIDFTQNELLIKHLTIHIEQIFRRVSRKTPLYNALVMSYFRDYVFATKITLSVIKILEDYLNEIIPIDEYGDFILFFQIALENSNSEKLKIGIYTGNNISEGALIYNMTSAQINLKRYELDYSEDLKSLSDFDIVLSSRNLSDYVEFVGKPKVIMGPFDKASLLTISDKLSNYYIEANSLRLNKYIHEDSILVIESNKKEDVMQEILEHLRRHNYLKDNVKDPLVFHEFGNRVIHIQDLHKIIKKEICLFVILQTPIIWDKTVVENLFLLKTKKDGDIDLPYLCGLFSNLINNPDAINQVREEADYRMLMRLLIDGAMR